MFASASNLIDCSDARCRGQQGVSKVLLSLMLGGGGIRPKFTWTCYVVEQHVIAAEGRREAHQRQEVEGGGGVSLHTIFVCDRQRVLFTVTYCSLLTLLARFVFNILDG